MEKAIPKKDIRTFSLPELREILEKLGEKSFRANQVYEWLWQKSVLDFDKMTNLSTGLREKLDHYFEAPRMVMEDSLISADGTIKSVFRLHDQNLVEGVLIPRENRMTACVSSQVGCSLSCKFCATGFMERKRNLDPGEIYDQFVLINRLSVEHYNRPLTNIVFMGMGEPLLNYANVLQAIDRISSEKGLNFSARRITVSTAGIAKMIKKLADENVKFKLALSLHAANDSKRSQIMPINDSNSLEALTEALQYFYHLTRDRITFEYIVFNKFNDTLQDAEELYRFTKKFLCKVNIIEYNPVKEAGVFRNADPDKVEQFAAYLENKGVNVRIRRSRGKDIDAACGQLANKRKGA